MSDSSYSQNNMGMAHLPIKLRDLGDGTFGIGQIDIGAWDSIRIASAGTNTLKSGSGILGGVIVGSAVSLGVITIYDNTAGSGTILYKITHPLSLLANQYHIPIKCKFNTGLTVTTSLGDDITILYM